MRRVIRLRKGEIKIKVKMTTLTKLRRKEKRI
jgi:hypothetical protein